MSSFRIRLYALGSPAVTTAQDSIDRVSDGSVKDMHLHVWGIIRIDTLVEQLSAEKLFPILLTSHLDHRHYPTSRFLPLLKQTPNLEKSATCNQGEQMTHIAT